MNVKQVIVIRKDLRMRRGKEISQGSHASMAWLLSRLYDPHDGPPWKSKSMKADFTDVELAWMDGQHTKVTLQVEGEKDLHEIYRAAKTAGLEVHMITDAGKTEFNGVPTKTCLAIGPDEAEKIDAITSELRLY